MQNIDRRSDRVQDGRRVSASVSLGMGPGTRLRANVIRPMCRPREGREKVRAVCCDGRRAAGVVQVMSGPLAVRQATRRARPGWLMACFA
jgi:hypothetical protein